MYIAVGYRRRVCAVVGTMEATETNASGMLSLLLVLVQFGKRRAGCASSPVVSVQLFEGATIFISTAKSSKLQGSLSQASPRRTNGDVDGCVQARKHGASGIF